MTMRKYLVTIHEDGRLTVSEYEEPSGYTYSAGEGDVYRSGYDRALRDVETILDAEKARCDTNSHITAWAVRSIECELLKTCVEKLRYEF